MPDRTPPSPPPTESTLPPAAVSTPVRPLRPVADRPNRLVLVVIAVLVGAALAAATYSVAASRPARWTAEPQLLVSPDSGLDAAATTSFYEALSRGQITATAAAIAGQRGVLDDALAQTGVDRTGVTVAVSVVPETTVLKISLSAERAEDARRVAGAVADESVRRLERLIPSYEVTPLTRGVPDPVQTGASLTEVLAATVAVGVGAAVGTYAALMALWRARRRQVTR